jgi:hypothetical protein
MLSVGCGIPVPGETVIETGGGFMDVESTDSLDAIRTRLQRRMALMMEHVQAIEGLLEGLQAVLRDPATTSLGQAHLKALQDVSDILRECQQLAFSNASDIIRETEEGSRQADAGPSGGT